MPSGRTHLRLGEIFAQDGRLSTLTLRALLREQEQAASSRRERPRIGELLLRYQLVDEVDIARALSAQRGCAYLEPDPANVRPDLFGDIPQALLDTYRFVPLGRDDQVLTIGVCDFEEPDLPDLLRSVTGLGITFGVMTGQRLRELQQAYRIAASALRDRVEIVGTSPAAGAALAVASSASTVPAREHSEEPTSAAPPVLRPATQHLPLPEPIEIPFPKAVDDLLHRLLSTAVRERYTNISFAPGDAPVRVVARRAGGRSDRTHVSAEARARVRRSLATAFGLEEHALRGPIHRRVRWAHEDGVALFEAVLFGPESPQVDLSLIAAREESWSLEDAGVAVPAVALIQAYLREQPRLLIVSGRALCDSQRLWVALLAQLAGEGRKVLSFERQHDTEIPGVFHHQIRPSDARQALFTEAGRSAFLASQSDVLAVRTEELPPDTQFLLELPRQDVLVTLSVTAASPFAALRQLEQAGRAPLTSGLYLTAYRVARLCPFCREGYPIAAAGLPRGFQALAGKIAYRSPGCESCQFSGRFGWQHFYEVLRLDGDRLDRDGVDFYARPLKEYLLEEGLYVPAIPDVRRALLAGSIGIDDYLELARRP